MKPGTTPTILGVIDNPQYLINSANVYMTVAQNNNVSITKTSADLAISAPDGEVAMTLTQEETLKFSPGIVQIEVGGVYANGYAWKTDISEQLMDPTIYHEVMY